MELVDVCFFKTFITFRVLHIVFFFLIQEINYVEKITELEEYEVFRKLL